MRRALISTLICLTVLTGWPQPMTAQNQIFQLPIVQFFTDTGVVLNGGKLCSYAAGTTSPLPTFSDPALSIQNANPLVLNAGGRFPNGVYLSPLSYKFTLLTAGSDSTCATGSTIWSQDQVPGGLAASTIIAGTFNSARLGSGTASIQTVLRGDSTWAAPCPVVTSSAIGAQNNFAPGISGPCTIVRMTNASLVTISGFDISGQCGGAGCDGQVIEIESDGLGQVDLTHQTLSTAANQLFNFAASAPTSLFGTLGRARYRYDLSKSRWVLFDHEQGQAITPTFNAFSYIGNAPLTWTVIAGNVTTQNYYLKGRRLTVTFAVSATTLGGTTNSLLLMVNTAYGSYSWATSATALPIIVNNAGAANATGFISCTAGAVTVLISQLNGANWTLGAGTGIFGQFTNDVQ